MDDNKLREEIQLLIGRDIRARRKEKGWSIEKLAGESGVNEKHLGDVELGKVMPNPYTIYKLSKGLGQDYYSPIYNIVDKELY